nr:MAG TPA: Toxin BmTX3/beta scaffold, TOXIN [Caudoviricetes sp.]
MTNLLPSIMKQFFVTNKTCKPPRQCWSINH